MTATKPEPPEAYLAELTTAVELVTPRQAQRWLNTCNVGNREIRRNHVKALAGAMENDEWVTTHQGIAFYADGTLCDGQHRLQACVDANRSFYAVITRGLDPAARVAVDVGRKRSSADVIRIHDATISRNMVATARLALSRGHAGGSSYGTTTPTRLQQFIGKHWDALTFIERVANKPRSIAAIRAAAMRAYYTCDHRRLAEFFKVFADTYTNDAGDGAAARLYVYMVSTRPSRSDSRDVYRRAESAIFRFLLYKKTNQLRPASQELFPIPGESEFPSETDVVLPR